MKINIPKIIITYSMYLMLFITLIVANGRAAAPIIEIEIRNHLFIPSEITIPENTKVKLVIHNHDETDEEFESYELNREKVILGKRKGVIFIGPLPAGEYPFFGEFFPKTAQGKVIVKEKETPSIPLLKRGR